MRSRPLIAGNWKMHGLAGGLAEAHALEAELKADPCAARVVLCPPATLLHRMAEALADGPVEVGGQDCHVEAQGPFTGDVSAEMLADAGARWVVVGHSERRTAYAEDDALVLAKAQAAVRAGLTPIVCVGESLAERQAGRTLEVVARQTRESLPDGGAAFALAYEPVWAIGSGLTPTLEQIAEVHGALRMVAIERCGAAGRAGPILYGGSVKPSNAAEILALPEVGGALVGGASLMAADFLGIVRAV